MPHSACGCSTDSKLAADRALAWDWRCFERQFVKAFPDGAWCVRAGASGLGHLLPRPQTLRALNFRDLFTDDDCDGFHLAVFMSPEVRIAPGAVCFFLGHLLTALSTVPSNPTQTSPIHGRSNIPTLFPSLKTSPRYRRGRKGVPQAVPGEHASGERRRI